MKSACYKQDRRYLHCKRMQHRTLKQTRKGNSFVRLGEPHDGGYLMCLDGFNARLIGAAFSMGVEHHDKWSEDVTSYFQIPVNQFDCTVSSSSCQACHFYPKCIVDEGNLNPVPGHELDGWSLKQALEATGQGAAPPGSLLLKMDIEASEWPIFAMEPSEMLQKFGQLIVEFHWLSQENNHPVFLQAMRNILNS